MAYKVKEVFYSIQGEGFHTGRPAVFCRFAGCNLWSGFEKARKSATCDFCDTDFVGTDGVNGGIFQNPKQLVEHILNFWPEISRTHPFIVFTGGEPLLQLDQQLVDTFRQRKVELAIETNGTIPPPENLDWICVSPKIGSKLVINKGNELKFVFPQKNTDPNRFLNFSFDHFYLQPLYDLNIKRNTELTIEFCKQNPLWKLSLQTHKFLGLP